MNDRGQSARARDARCLCGGHQCGYSIEKFKAAATLAGFFFAVHFSQTRLALFSCITAANDERPRTWTNGNGDVFSGRYLQYSFT